MLDLALDPAEFPLTIGAGEATEKCKWAQQLRNAGLTTPLPPESLRDPEAILDSVRRHLVTREAVERGELGAEERGEQRLKEMLAAGRWADVGNEAMHGIAERWASGGVVEELVTYVTVFKMGSGVLHVRQPDMFMKLAPDGTMYPNLQADPTFLPFALFISNLLYVSILSMVNEVFGLRLGESIKDLLGDLRNPGAAAKGEGSAPAPESTPTAS